MAELVYEQGTVLDRIDYNIEETLQNAKKANIQLTKVLFFYLIEILIFFYYFLKKRLTSTIIAIDQETASCYFLL